MPAPVTEAVKRPSVLAAGCGSLPNRLLTLRSTSARSRADPRPGLAPQHGDRHGDAHQADQHLAPPRLHRVDGVHGDERDGEEHPVHAEGVRRVAGYSCDTAVAS